MRTTQAVVTSSVRAATLALIAAVAVGCAQHHDRRTAHGYGTAGTSDAYAATRTAPEQYATERHDYEHGKRCDNERDRDCAMRMSSREEESRPHSAWDEKLETRVKHTLSENKRTKALDLDVDARHGVVYLSGHVDKPAQKRTAGEVAAKVKGVKRVHNDIEVGQNAQR